MEWKRELALKRPESEEEEEEEEIDLDGLDYLLSQRNRPASPPMLHYSALEEARGLEWERLKKERDEAFARLEVLKGHILTLILNLIPTLIGGFGGRKGSGGSHTGCMGE